ncbi:ABC transporter ATP-binding protein [Trueperella pyogenes]|uniref:ABC transporter ATP-binding protein n=1 Tax=Trueperella pyogenes TaxID=1661 RepID=A0A3Q9GKF6_9ACTO|nr:ABC transporter ATP-binding protein [Trueperella pyogenes]AZR06999.1 ABC transporter ATP-binding protein [Trueperella pyogenes]UVJ53677.1 ABC transporter ATP-binding protein/permease [Trueperella pyogenes]UVJ55668.1 ABC transporter ATP-binding protein/permease [Trueperella pyogenes]UVJ57706.1 ABC transporter ATP-binding protein/permease [Trueperella pyogenes]UVJ59669.1 ABC transporter ATP-binding protein/permease [Trueperella pyogenes]
MAKTMGTVAMLRASRRLENKLEARGRVLVWIARVVSGVIQGVGLLALLQLAGVWARPDGGDASTYWMWVLVAVALCGMISIFLRDRFSYDLAFGVMRNTHRLVGDKLAVLPLGWFSSTVTGRLSRLGAATVNDLGNLSAHMATMLVVSSTTLVTLLAGLLWWYPKLGLVFAICLLAYALLTWVLTYVDAAAQAYSAPAAVELADRIVEFSACQAMLRSCNRVPYSQLDDAVAENRRRGFNSMWVEAVGNFFAGMASQIICVVMIVVGVQQAFSGDLSALEVVAVIGISLQMVQYLVDISNARMALHLMGPTMATIIDVLDAQRLTEPEASAPVASQQVELRGVDFSYQDSRRVLDGVSFVVPPRTMTALVGPSGAGKTTIARLICRFWDVDAGAVLVGDADVRDLTTEDLMKQVSMVFQDVYLFDDTLEANIRVGDPDASEDRVRWAAELAGVSEIVDRLPDGWQSRVGEGGTSLSGGERQRISVARAILKKAPIVLFDEATSALDAENEANLTRAFDYLRQESTVLVIAHKLNTVTAADQIVVLNDRGQVAQVGTHEELVGVDGIYREFWQNRELASGWKITR